MIDASCSAKWAPGRRQTKPQVATSPEPLSDVIAGGRIRDCYSNVRVRVAHSNARANLSRARPRRGVGWVAVDSASPIPNPPLLSHELLLLLLGPSVRLLASGFPLRRAAGSQRCSVHLLVSLDEARLREMESKLEGKRKFEMGMTGSRLPAIAGRRKFNLLLVVRRMAGAPVGTRSTDRPLAGSTADWVVVSCKSVPRHVCRMTLEGGSHHWPQASPDSNPVALAIDAFQSRDGL